MADDAQEGRGGLQAPGAAVEAVAYVREPKLKADFHRIGARRGRNIARVAIARKLLTLVYYGLRDGEIRCLAQADEAG